MRAIALFIIALSVSVLGIAPASADSLPFNLEVFFQHMRAISNLPRGNMSLIGFSFKANRTELNVYFSVGSGWEVSNCQLLADGRWLCSGAVPLQYGAAVISPNEVPALQPRIPPSGTVPRFRIPPPPLATADVTCILPDSSKERMSAASCISLGGHF